MAGFMRRLFVLDATPLIYLLRGGFHNYFPKLGAFYTTSAVLKELRAGGPELPENLAVNGLLDKKMLVGKDPKKLVPRAKGVHEAELSVISLARELNAVAVLDDLPAKKYAELLGLPAVHSSSLVIHAAGAGIVSAEEAVETIDAMVSGGWRCDAETYSLIIKAIHSVTAPRGRKH